MLGKVLKDSIAVSLVTLTRLSCDQKSLGNVIYLSAFVTCIIDTETISVFPINRSR